MHRGRFNPFLEHFVSGFNLGQSASRAKKEKEKTHKAAPSPGGLPTVDRGTQPFLSSYSQVPESHRRCTINPHLAVRFLLQQNLLYRE